MKNKIILIFAIILLCITLLPITASATYTSNDPEVKSGGSFSITVKSSENLQNYDLVLSSYEGLTYKGCSANENAAVNSSTGKISYATLGTGTATLGTYTFEAPKVSENKTYKVVFNINGTSNTSTVTVKAEENKPDEENNNQYTPVTPSNSGILSSVTVNGKTYNKPNQDITVTVGNEVETTTVSGVSTDGSAVSGTGNISLKVGTNTVKLTVNGTDYYVRIVRLEKQEEVKPNIIDETEPEEEEPKEVLALKSLELKEFELTPKFSKDIFTYTLDIDMEEEDVEKLEITAISNQENAKIEITGNENLKEGENIINITLTSEDETETVTYQIKVNKIVKSTEVVGESNIDDVNQELEDATKTSNIIQLAIIIIAIVGLTAGIIFALIEYWYTNKEDDDEHEFNEPFYIKEDEEGRLDIVDKEETKTEPTGYIEELYKNSFSEEELEQDIEKEKRKKAKGKHF